MKNSAGQGVDDPAVDFIFIYRNATNTCTFYKESFSAINMTGSGGLVNLQLGSGSRLWPTSGVIALKDIFNNTGVALSCLEGGTATPTSFELRYMIMQFNYAGSGGWNTLSPVSINSVPYSMYAGLSENAKLFDGRTLTDFLLKPASCSAGQVVAFDGTNYICQAAGSGTGTVTDVTAATPLSSSGGTTPNITIAKANGTTDGYLSSADWTTFNSKLSNFSTLLSSDITGKLGYTPAANNDSRFTDQRTPINDSVTSAKILDGTITSADISNGAIEANKLAQMGASSGQVLKWNGSAWVASSDDTGVGSVTSVTASGPLSSSGGATPNITLAKSNATTDGYLSSADFTTFAAKLSDFSTLLSSDITGKLGYTPVNPATAVVSVAGRTGTVTLSSSDISGLTFGTTAGTFAQGNDSRLSDTRTPTDGSVTAVKIANATITFDKLNQSGASTGQVIKWDGSAWVASADNSNGGTVTTVTASGPLSSSGGATPNITLAKSNSTTDGYLSSADFTTFAAKLSDFSTLLSSDITGKLGYTPVNPSTLGSAALLNSNQVVLVSNMPANCNAGQTLTFSSPTGSWVCSNIVLSNNSVLSAMISSVDWSKVANRPTTVAGYGITMTSSDVTTALGYTAANSSDVSGKVSKAGDTMTGTLNLATNGLAVGTNQLVVSGGKVGVGTASPVSNFEVKGTTTTNGQFRIETTDDVAAAGPLFMRYNDINGSAAYTGFGGTSNQFNIVNYKSGPIALSTSGSERMRIDSTGNIGIGTTSPNVSGWPDTTVTISGKNDAANGQGIIELVNNRTTAAASDKSGTLNFVSRNNPGAEKRTGLIQSVLSGSGGVNGYGGTLYFNTKQDNAATTSIAMTINDLGNVGIGNSSPAYKLDVSGDINVTGNFRVNGSIIGGGGGTIGGSGTTNYLPKFSAATTLANSLIFDNGTNVGIGTASPSTLLHVSAASDPATFEGTSANTSGRIVLAGNVASATTEVGGIAFKNTSSVQTNAIIKSVTEATVTAGALTFSTGTSGTATEKLRITSGGNVGIGNVSPNYKLDVTGDVNVTGNFKINGTNINSGTVSSVTSANTDISVATTTTTPVLTLNSGTGNNQILKLNGTAQIPAVDGSLVTSLNASNLASGTVAAARMPALSGDVTMTAGTTTTTIAANAVTAAKLESATNGQLFIGNGTGFTKGALTGTASQITVTNGSGTITLSTPQNIATSSSPTFTGMTLSGLSNGLVKSTTGVLSGGNTVALGSEVSGTLPAANGGTGQSSYTVGDLLYASTTSALSKLPASTSGYVLTSNGAGAAPSWQAASGGTVGGSGTTNYLPKFSAASTLANSLIFDNGTNVSVGPYSPNPLDARLQVFNDGSTPQLKIGDTGCGSCSFSFGRAQSGAAGYLELTGNQGAYGLQIKTGSLAVGSYAGYPVSKLDVLGNASFGTYAYTNAAPANGLIVSGTVGIGNPSPTYKLDVTGDVNVTGNFKINGTNINSGTVTSVTSANTDISVATTTTTPVLTLNSGTGNNQILKLNGTAQIPAVNGSLLTALNATNLGSGTVPAARMPALTGDVTMTVGTTATTIAADAVTSAKILDGTIASADLSTASVTAAKLESANNGELYIGNGTGFTKATLTGTTNQLSVANGAGTITLSTPQNIHTAATPTFSGLTLSGITGNTLLRANGSGVLANATSADVTGLLGFTPANATASWTLTASGDVTRTTGNVGIGTATPATALEVRGNISNYASGDPAFLLMNTTAASGANYITSDQRMYSTTSSRVVTRAISGWVDHTDATRSSYWSLNTLVGGSLAETFRIHNGNVGIGNANPTVKLQVGTANTDELRTGVLSFTGNSAVKIDEFFGPRITLSEAAGSSGMRVVNSASSQVFVAKSNGRIGINNEDIPGSNLAVKGNASVGSSYSATAAPANGMIVEGYLGIGTTNPGYPLTISSPTANILHSMVSSNTSATYLELNNTSTGGRDYYIGSTGQTNGQGAGNLVIWDATAGANRFTINSSGYVGIGTTNPITILDVAGSSRFGTSTNRVSLGTGMGANEKGIEVRYDAVNDAGVVQVHHQAVGYKNLSLNPNGGNVGIGTSLPTNKMSVAGAIGIGAGYGAFEAGGVALGAAGTSPNMGSISWGDGTGWKFNFGTNIAGTFTPRMTLVDSGNVGIGTTTPSYTLHVNGSVAGTSAYNNLSDARLKKNVTNVSEALNKIDQIRGVTFDWDHTVHPELKLGDRQELGVIAQEVEKVFPQAVSQDSKTGIKSVAYSMLIAPLIEAVKELFAISKDQSREIAAIKSENEKLKQENAEVKARLDRIEQLLNQKAKPTVSK